MATRIEIEYDRLFVNSELQALLARAAASINVLQQLGVAFQSLPGIEMAGYQTESDALEADLATFNGLVNQLRPLLEAMDLKARPLSEKNSKVLGTLRGLLRTSAQIALLDQITGATPEPSPPPAPPGP
jgi:hypothetical protein